MITTPLGTATVSSGIVSLAWKRNRGVLINLSWEEGSLPDNRLVEYIDKNLDYIIQQGLIRIEADNFPNHLKAVLPECIDFSDERGDFSLIFYCPNDEDYLIGVTYKDGLIIHDWEAH